jgi:superkiller protein 3
MNCTRILLSTLALVFALDAAAAQTAAPTPAAPAASQGAAQSQSAARARGGDAGELMRICGTMYRLKKYDEALASCTEAAELRPNEFRLHAIIGLIYMAQAKLKDASDSFAKAIELQPREKELYLLKATADARRNAREEAVAACRKAVEIDPSFAEAQRMLGDLLIWDEKRRDEAIAAYRAALKADPDILLAYEGMGGVLADTKDAKGAEEVFRQAMDLDPKHMAGRFELGRMLVKQGRLAEARALWEGRTSDEDATHPSFISVLEHAENLKRATEELAKRPEDPDALVAMGLAVMDGPSWVVDGRQERALVYFRKALGLKPGFAKAQYAVCKAYVQIADTFSDKKPLVDVEIAKLRRLDPKLADEAEEYKKSYANAARLEGPPAVKQ